VIRRMTRLFLRWKAGLRWCAFLLLWAHGLDLGRFGTRRETECGSVEGGRATSRTIAMSRPALREEVMLQ